jgi:hypothetical protein
LSAFGPSRLRTRACVPFGPNTGIIAGQRVLLPEFKTAIDRLETKE